VVDQLFEIGDSPAELRQVRVNASPVRDARGTVRGCFVSFNDVTELHRANRDLKKTLEDLRSSQSVVEARNSELRASKNRIEQQNRELERLAHYDPLTNVLNRRAFLEQAVAHFDLARADGKPLACVMTDIDKFKSVNDNFGHAVGDDVICAVARTLTNALRPGDLLCRYGGEEFCIVLPGLDPRAALAVAERLRARVEAEVGAAMRSTPGLRVTASFGVSAVALGAVDLKQLIEEADEALYASKEAGRNFVSLFASAPPALGAWPTASVGGGDSLTELAEEVAGHLEHRRAG
jgi:diguanylate cyclase (GGDEF)-like protein